MKLVVHIGHGKTGSSSIQKTLLQNASMLSDQGVKYLGLMLEHASNPNKKPWQHTSGSDNFFDSKEKRDANDELFEVLSDEIRRLDESGFSLAIWSNEWLATRGAQVLPALAALKERGADIEVQCYVRRHDEWAQSAYLQWGLKHKTYEGPIRNFESWLPVFGQRDFRFGPSLQDWNGVVDTRLRVFNYDAAGDVVSHFLAANQISGVAPVKDNITPDALLLAAHAVFNARAKGRVVPSAFDSAHKLMTKFDENQSVLPTMDRLTAGEAALAGIVDSRRDDIEKINSFLSRSGEPPLSFDKPVKQVLHPTPWEMDQLILKLVYSLVEETAELRNQIAALKAELDDQKNDKVH